MLYAELSHLGGIELYALSFNEVTQRAYATYTARFKFILNSTRNAF